MPSSENAPTLRRASDADRPVAERLWLMFRHDLSELRAELPESDGTFRADRLHAAFDDPDWAAHLLHVRHHPVGLAIVRGLHAPVRTLSAYFVVRGARRAGVGLAGARQLVTADPGAWQVAFQEQNTAAIAFWRHVATDLAAGPSREDHRPVPGRPDLLPDVWISFSTEPHR